MLHLLSLIVYFYFALSTLYLLILAIAGRFAKRGPYELVAEKKKILVLIPAYREDNVIVETAEKCARHNYPSASFEVMIIADSLQNDTVEKLQKIPVRTLAVGFEVSTKAKSLYAGLDAVKKEGFDVILILDADNIMADNCLEQVNSAFHTGFLAIQCHRSAKNQNTAIAQLGAISEEININLFRRGPAALGLSAMPLGSGMAFQFELILNIFKTPGILDNPAEDREIEIQLMRRRLRMKFLNDIYVYDEKVTESASFQKQRIRWLEAQLNHFLRFFKPDLRNTARTRVYYHIFFQTMLLPRLLYLLICGLIVFLIILQYLFNVSFIYPIPVYWLCLIAVYFIVLLISIPGRFYSVKTLRAIAYIPVLMLSMLKAILKLKRNRKEFLHTSKTFNAE